VEEREPPRLEQEPESEQRPEPLGREQPPALMVPPPMHSEQAPESQNSAAPLEPKHQGSTQAQQPEPGPGQARSSCIHLEIESPKRP
jgi:hypothetical protein